MKMAHLFRTLGGYVSFSAEGGFPERLLNLCARERIVLWNTRREGAALYACCRARDYRRLRPIARKSCVRMRLGERFGLWFRLRRYRSRVGIPIGLIIYGLLLQLLSQYIWVVEVEGNVQVPTGEILAAVSDLQVAPGEQIRDVDVSRLQLRALKQLPALSWITVNMEGSVAHIAVTERKDPDDPLLPKTPANVKAGSDGIIVSMQVYEGESLVQVGDAVAEGMLLVSGVRTTALGDYLTHAHADIMAQTTRVLTVTVPLSEAVWTPTDHRLVRTTWHVFGLHIPWYNSGEMTGHYRAEPAERMLTVGGRQLPIGYSRVQYTEQRLTVIKRTEDEAKQAAWDRLMEQETVLADTVQILSRHEVSELVDGGWRVTVTYECIENIAVCEAIETE